MKTTICTLFEGNYHHGLVGLVNSLAKQQFSGEIFAGYRGELPKWTSSAKLNSDLPYDGAKSMELSGGLILHLVPLSTDYHFTNYKPNFMLELWEGPASDSDAMIYLDPDIVVIEPWPTFEKWMDSGVALCEDVNSPVAKNHPIRVGWRKYFSKYGLNLKYKESVYVNGGFVGLKKEHKDFVSTWKLIQEHMAEAIGGLERSSLQGQQLSEEATGVFAPFSKTDQDALNAAVEASDIQVSIAGKETMGFIAGKALLPHALGQPKPWDNAPIGRSLRGYRPRLIDKVYWDFAKGEIQSMSASKIARLKRWSKWASFIGRFYNRY